MKGQKINQKKYMKNVFHREMNQSIGIKMNYKLQGIFSLRSI